MVHVQLSCFLFLLSNATSGCSRSCCRCKQIRMKLAVCRELFLKIVVAIYEQSIFLFSQSKTFHGDPQSSVILIHWDWILLSSFGNENQKMSFSLHGSAQSNWRKMIPTRNVKLWNESCLSIVWIRLTLKLSCYLSIEISKPMYISTYYLMTFLQPNEYKIVPFLLKIKPKFDCSSFLIYKFCTNNKQVFFPIVCKIVKTILGL